MERLDQSRGKSRWEEGKRKDGAVIQHVAVALF